MGDRLSGVLCCVWLSILAFSTVMRGETCKNLKYYYYYYYYYYYFCSPSLLVHVAILILLSLPHCPSGAPLFGTVLWVYSSILGFFIGGLYRCGCFMRCCSLPLCLKDCFPLLWGGVFVGVGVEVVCVCGVFQNNSIVGWSACSFAFFLHSFGVSLCVWSPSFSISSARSIKSSDWTSVSVFNKSFRVFL